jgi:hypothetical protein
MATVVPHDAWPEPEVWDFLVGRLASWHDETAGVLDALMERPSAESIAWADAAEQRGRALLDGLAALATDHPQASSRLAELRSRHGSRLRAIGALLGVLRHEMGESLATGDDPITTWKAAARALGISEDTLCERRKAAGDRSRPWWPSPEALREWFRELQERPAAGKKQRRRRVHVIGAAVDWDQVELGPARARRRDVGG